MNVTIYIMIVIYIYYYWKEDTLLLSQMDLASKVELLQALSNTSPPSPANDTSVSPVGGLNSALTRVILSISSDTLAKCLEKLDLDKVIGLGLGFRVRVRVKVRVRVRIRASRRGISRRSVAS